MCECVCLFESEQHECVLMCEVSDRRSTGCSCLTNSTLFFLGGFFCESCDRWEEMRDQTYLWMPWSLLLLLYLLKFKPKRFLPSPHVFSNSLPLILKSTTQVEFTLRCSSQMVKKVKIKNATVTIETKAQPPLPTNTSPHYMLVCPPIKLSNLSDSYLKPQQRLPPPPFPFLSTSRCMWSD